MKYPSTIERIKYDMSIHWTTLKNTKTNYCYMQLANLTDITLRKMPHKIVHTGHLHQIKVQNKQGFILFVKLYFIT